MPIPMNKRGNRVKMIASPENSLESIMSPIIKNPAPTQIKAKQKESISRTLDAGRPFTLTPFVIFSRMNFWKSSLR
jgi:hypothetical protein